MKLFLAVFVILSLVLTVSCAEGSSSGTTPTATTMSETGSEQSIGFTVSDYHFVKNTYKGDTNPSYLLMRTFSAFDSQFGVGAVMGMDRSKLVTEESMKGKFAFSIIYQGNNIQEFGIEKVTLIGKQLRVYYTSKVTQPNASWTCNCHTTILIDNCDFDLILLYENGKALSNFKIKEIQ